MWKDNCYKFTAESASEELWKSVKISYRYEFGVFLFRNTVYNVLWKIAKQYFLNSTVMGGAMGIGPNPTTPLPRQGRLYATEPWPLFWEYFLKMEI